MPARAPRLLHVPKRTHSPVEIPFELAGHRDEIAPQEPQVLPPLPQQSMLVIMGHAPVPQHEHGVVFQAGVFTAVDQREIQGGGRILGEGIPVALSFILSFSLY